MSKTRVLICGVTGFIGRNIAERLAENKDYEISGTFFHSQPDKNLAGGKITLIKTDLTQKTEVDRVVKDKDIIIQASAVTSGANDIVKKPYLHVTDNAVMNSLIFRAAFENQVKHLIFFSCSVMYPNQASSVKETDFNGQITDKYFGVGWTKVYLEKMCEFFSKISPTKYTVIRHSNIYGPHDKFDLEHSHVLGATITKVLTSEDKIVVWGDGSEKRDLLYVSDLVDFVELILKKQKIPFELINIGAGTAISISQLVKTVIDIVNKNPKIEYNSSMPTIKFSLSLNTEKAQKMYGWIPKVTLKEGINKTIQWYKKNIL